MDQAADSQTGGEPSAHANLGSFRDLSAIREAKKSNTFRKLLGRVKKTNKRFQEQSSDNLSSSINSDNKLRIGQDTYTFIFQKVQIMDTLMNIIIFMDVSQ